MPIAQALQKLTHRLASSGNAQTRLKNKLYCLHPVIVRWPFRKCYQDCKWLKHAKLKASWNCVFVNISHYFTVGCCSWNMSYIVYPLSTTCIHEVKHKWDCYCDTVHLRIVRFPPSFRTYICSLNILQSCFPDVFETSFLKAFNKSFILSLCMATN